LIRSASFIILAMFNSSSLKTTPNPIAHFLSAAKQFQKAWSSFASTARSFSLPPTNSNPLSAPVPAALAP
jgi:hypothetical protein